MRLNSTFVCPIVFDFVEGMGADATAERVMRLASATGDRVCSLTSIGDEGSSVRDVPVALNASQNER